MAVVGADGYRRVDHLRDLVHDFLDLRLQFGLFGFELLEAVGLRRDLRLDGLGLGGLGRVLLGLAHQHADLLGELVAVGAQRVRLGDGRAVFGVEGDDLIDERQFVVLEFFADVFLDQFGVFPHKTNVEHCDAPRVIN